MKWFDYTLSSGAARHQHDCPGNEKVSQFHKNPHLGKFYYPTAKYALPLHFARNF
jgi:hypothetical protein